MTECDVISCRVNDGVGLLMRPDSSVQAKDKQHWSMPAEASILSRLIKQTDDINITYTERVVNKIVWDPTLNLGPILPVNLQAYKFFCNKYVIRILTLVYLYCAQ